MAFPRSILHASLQYYRSLRLLLGLMGLTHCPQGQLLHTCTKAMRDLYEVTEHSSSSHLSTSSRTPTHFAMKCRS